MIYEDWFGVFNKKGELLAVEESEEQAKHVALNLELDPRPKAHTNRVLQVVVITERPVEDLIIEILEKAKLKIPGFPHAKFKPSASK